MRQPKSAHKKRDFDIAATQYIITNMYNESKSAFFTNANLSVIKTILYCVATTILPQILTKINTLFVTKCDSASAITFAQKPFCNFVNFSD